MKNPNASFYANDFADAIDVKFNVNNSHPSLGEVVVGVLPGRKYDKITLGREKSMHNNGVHVFVNRETGDLLKPAGWNAPQKNSDGTLAVRMNVATPEGFAQAVDAADEYGRYLYVR